MSAGNKVPSAWDDDWVDNADVSFMRLSQSLDRLIVTLKQTSTANSEPAPTNKKLTKAEKRARQAEFNRQIWADALADVSCLPFETLLSSIAILRRTHTTSRRAILCRSSPILSLQ